MRHRVFALFDTTEELDRVLAELEEDPLCKGRCSVVAHKDHATDDDVGFGETDTRRWVGRGMLFGAAGGAATGLIMGPLGLIAVGPLAAAAMGVAAGSAYIGIIGALTGASGPPAALTEMAEHLKQGGVLLTIDTPSLAARSDVEAIVERHGGTVRRA